jgi:hypothetical protein
VDKEPWEILRWGFCAVAVVYIEIAVSPMSRGFGVYVLNSTKEVGELITEGKGEPLKQVGDKEIRGDLEDCH